MLSDYIWFIRGNHPKMKNYSAVSWSTRLAQSLSLL